MSIRHLRAALPGLAIALIPFSQGTAHEIVGNRFFPTTLGIDDPGVNDEMSIPTVSSFKTGDDPSVVPMTAEIDPHGSDTDILRLGRPGRISRTTKADVKTGAFLPLPSRQVFLRPEPLKYPALRFRA